MGVRAGSAAILIAAALGLSACAGQKVPPAPTPLTTTAQAPTQLPATQQMASLTTGIDKPEPKRIELSDADFNCLVQAVYFEAGQEIPEGQRAVAEVILHRVDDPRFPKTVCGVIHDKNPKGCQFSWWCDGKSDATPDADRWATSKQAVTDVLDGAYPDPTNGALFYHARFVRPRWSKKLTRVAAIGGHIFYR
ncbi:MAG TPA: cell wall hydrolase [Candidatus Acidoferrum sp.]|nr:cell wall hydrolase [Candidatus Acidoferrum sp.]